MNVKIKRVLLFVIMCCSLYSYGQDRKEIKSYKLRLKGIFMDTKYWKEIKRIRYIPINEVQYETGILEDDNFIWFVIDFKKEIDSNNRYSLSIVFDRTTKVLTYVYFCTYGNKSGYSTWEYYEYLKNFTSHPFNSTEVNKRGNSQNTLPRNSQDKSK